MRRSAIVPNRSRSTAVISCRNGARCPLVSRSIHCKRRLPPTSEVSLGRMFAFAHVWPWISLGAAGLLFFLLTINALRSDRGVSRWRDIVWLTWAGVLACLLHQFEEHGIDADGKAYAFRAFMCAEIGLPDPRTCPVPLSFITALNVATVWIAGAMLHAVFRGSLLAFVNGQLDLDVLLLLLIASPLLSALTVAVLSGRRSFRLFAT